MKNLKPGAARALFLSTTAFGVTFAVWGLIAALAPTFAQAYNLSAKARSLMIAIPVLLGSIGRLPAGMLADRLGGRNVFSTLLFLSAIPAIAIGFSNSYAQLLGLGVLLGVAGTSFSVGVSFTSRWFTPEQQGTALGVYGMGNIGQSVAVFGAPVLALALGSWRPVFWIFAALAVGWGLIFYLFARDAVSAIKPKTLNENLEVLRRSRLAWVLSLFLFLDLRWIRRVFDLPADAAEGFVQAHTGRRGRAHGRICAAGDTDETAGRHAGRSIRRRASAGWRVHRGHSAGRLDGLSIHADFHCGRAGRSSGAGPGKRRGLQTGSRVFS